MSGPSFLAARYLEDGLPGLGDVVRIYAIYRPFIYIYTFIEAIRKGNFARSFGDLLNMVFNPLNNWDDPASNSIPAMHVKSQSGIPAKNKRSAKTKGGQD